jgi:hypothetical protein
MAHSLAGLAASISTIMKIAFGDNTKCSDSGEHPAFAAVDFVDPIAVADLLSIVSTRDETSRENIT